MAMPQDNPAPEAREVQVAILAKAPIAGLAKTRLVPALSARCAARLQRRLTLQTLATAAQAQVGPITLWCAPDTGHRFFRAVHRTLGVECRAQPEGDLGERMHAAFAHHCRRGPLLLIGTDCPALAARHLRAAADALRAGCDAVIHPAADGGYVLVGLRRPQAALFSGMRWGTADVMAQTRWRARDLRVTELETLWDVDTPEDLSRLRTLPGCGHLVQARGCSVSPPAPG